MADLAASIAKAKQAGYSDAEIAAYIGRDPALGSKIQTARKAGYKDAEIVSHLAADTPQSRANADARKNFDAIKNTPILGAHSEGLMARARGGMFGFMDEAQGAVNAIKTGAQNALAPVTGKPAGYGMKEAYAAGRTASLEQEADYAKRHPVNNITQQVAGGSWLPAAKTTNALKAGLYGAGVGAVSGFGSGESIEDRLKKAAIGAATGFGLGAAGQTGSNALTKSAEAARAAAPSAARQLSRQGVQLTPGQMMGGTAQRIEDAATSLPVVGDAIRNRRIDGLDSFNRTAIQRVLDPIGETLPATGNIGRDGVELASQKVSEAYKKALAPVQLQIGDDFAGSVKDIIAQSKLPPDLQDELNSVLRNTVAPAQDKVLSGADWKMIDADLGAAAAAASNAAGQKPSASYLANTLKDIQTAWRQTLQQTAPEAFNAVEAANAANANLVRIRQAAQMTGAKGGQFTPNQLNNAVRAGDSTAGNRAFATGNALMQDLTDPAVQVLPSTVPDSGTALRSTVNALGLTGGGIALGVNPQAAAVGATGVGLGMALYSRPVQNLINAAYRASDPGQVRAVVAELQSLAAQNPGLQAEAARAIAELTSGRSGQQGRPQAQGQPSQ